MPVEFIRDKQHRWFGVNVWCGNRLAGVNLDIPLVGCVSVSTPIPCVGSVGVLFTGSLFVQEFQPRVDTAVRARIEERLANLVPCDTPAQSDPLRQAQRRRREREKAWIENRKKAWIENRNGVDCDACSHRIENPKQPGDIGTTGYCDRVCEGSNDPQTS